MSSSIRGFFYLIGHKDRPFSYNDNNNFGHEYLPPTVGTKPALLYYNWPVNPTPSSKYSINDIRNFIKTSVEIPVSHIDGTESSLGKNKFIFSSILDSSVNPDFVNVGTSIVELEALGLIQAYRVLEFAALYKMEELLKASTNPTIYTNKFDELLVTTLLVGDVYVRGSITVYPSKFISDRIGSVTFEIKLADESRKTCEFYITPDDYFDKYAMNYENCTVKHDEYLKSNSNNSIMEVLNSVPFKVEVDNDYQNVTFFKTLHVMFDANGVKTGEYRRQFFIYNHLYTGCIPALYKQIINVKKYLEILYDRDFERLKREYPELFTDTNIDIYPLLNNVQNGLVILPTTITTIVEELDKRGIPLSIEDNNSNVELVILEGCGKYDNVNMGVAANNQFRIPLIAIDKSPTAIKGPIADKYPRFGIRSTGMINTGDDWEVLHFYIKLFSKIVLHMIPNENFHNMTDSQIIEMLNIPSNFDLVTERYRLFNISYLKSISFGFHGNRYRIYGYNYEVIHGPEQII